MLGARLETPQMRLLYRAGITAARVAEEIVRSGAELVVHVGDISVSLLKL